MWLPVWQSESTGLCLPVLSARLCLAVSESTCLCPLFCVYLYVLFIYTGLCVYLYVCLPLYVVCLYTYQFRSVTSCLLLPVCVSTCLGCSRSDIEGQGFHGSSELLFQSLHVLRLLTRRQGNWFVFHWLQPKKRINQTWNHGVYT